MFSVLQSAVGKSKSFGQSANVAAAVHFQTPISNIKDKYVTNDHNYLKLLQETSSLRATVYIRLVIPKTHWQNLWRLLEQNVHNNKFSKVSNKWSPTDTERPCSCCHQSSKMHSQSKLQIKENNKITVLTYFYKNHAIYH